MEEESNTYGNGENQAKDDDLELQAIGDKKNPSESDIPQGSYRLEFGVRDTPPVNIMLLYALQMLMSNLSYLMAVVHIFTKSLCAQNDNVFTSKLFSSSIFMSGLTTVLQVTLGLRLPIFQGSSFMFIAPILIIMDSGKWSCHPTSNLVNGTNVSVVEEIEPWRGPVLEVSGSLAVASLTQVLLGYCGIIGLLMRFIGPLTVVPVISLIGFALFHPVVDTCLHSWSIAALTVLVIVLCATVIDHWEVPIPSYSRKKGMYFTKYPIFKIFANIWGIVIAWAVSGILTAAGVFDEKPGEVGYLARTDTRLTTLQEAPWFYFPYPGQWGMPTVSGAAVVSMIAATLASTVESVGDYIATAPVCQVPPPPKHAINRGIATEGIGSILAALVGTCHGTTSYSNMMGFIVYTGVASRVMWQVLGVMMMVFGIFNKFGAFLSLIPDPVVGALMLVGLASLIGVSLANLNTVDMDSPRNQLVLGIALLTGVCMPHYMTIKENNVFVGVPALDQIIAMFLSSGPFFGGVVGFILDNLLPGSRKSRGFHDPNEVYARQLQKMTGEYPQDRGAGAGDPAGEAAGETARMAGVTPGHGKRDIRDAMALYYPVRPITKLLVKYPMLQKLPFLPKVESDNW